MSRILVRWLINTIAIMLAVRFVPGIVYNGSWWGILVVGMIFGIVNTFIRPIVRLFTFPLLILTLGLFTFIINAMMLSITSWFSYKFGLGFHVESFSPALWGSLVISIVSVILSFFMPADKAESRN